MTIEAELKAVLAILLTVPAYLGGSYWICSLYRHQPDVLTYPADADQRGRIRKRSLPILLAGLFGWDLMQLQSGQVYVGTIFLMAFQYFLLLYTFTDFEQQVIFDHMLIPFAILGLFQTLLLQQPLLDHLSAAAAGGIIFLLLAILTRGGIGGGDIKLIAALGLWLGTDNLLTISMAGLIFGGIAAFFLILTGQKKRTDYFAYGPYFTLTAIILYL